MQIITFSFNRSLQLDTLLYSVLSHWKSPAFTLDVVYNTSSKEHQKGYDKLIEKMETQPHIAFHKEQEFVGGGY